MIRNIQVKIVSISILSRTQLSAAPSVRIHSRCVEREVETYAAWEHFEVFRVMILSSLLCCFCEIIDHHKLSAECKNINERVGWREHGVRRERI